MVGKKSIWWATFVSSELLKGTYRRLNFKNVKNEEGIIIKDVFCIDESENLSAIDLHKGQPVSFIVDENFNVVNFCYPHDSREETYTRIQQKGKSILEKLREKRKK